MVMKLHQKNKQFKTTSLILVRNCVSFCVVFATFRMIFNQTIFLVRVSCESKIMRHQDTHALVTRFISHHSGVFLNREDDVIAAAAAICCVPHTLHATTTAIGFLNVNSPLPLKTHFNKDLLVLISVNHEKF